MMINVRTIRKLADGEGLTLKAGKIIRYKSGWQVADYGMETTDPVEVSKELRRMGGNCGIWFSEGVYYVDHSYRVQTKHEALEIGREHAQISVYGWARDVLAYC